MHSIVLKSAAATAMLSTLLIGATPATATDQVNQYGSRVNCLYSVTQRTNGSWTRAKLKHLDVKPPTMKAIVGSSETVRWRFWVLRSTNGDSAHPTVTYYSPWQTGTATPSTAAHFSTMGVDVAVPRNGDPAGTSYQVKLVMQWFNAHETDVILTHMRWIVGGSYFDTENYCPGVEQLQVDGE
jgi:hypothetical protein